MNPDGSNKKMLVNNDKPRDPTELEAGRPEDRLQPASSSSQAMPNAHDQIFVMDRDGSNYVNITNDLSKSDYRPSWSRDGTKIIFEPDLLGLWAMNPDGSNRSPFPSMVSPDRYASWSPAGDKIAFVSYRSPLPN